MRIDDICVGDDSEPIQAAIIDWFADHQIPFNFHIITSTWDADHPWPSDCSDPSAMWCDSPVVQSIQKHYDAGRIVGKDGSGFLSLGCHASNHNEWPAHITGQNTDLDWQENDIAQSMNVLNAAYPSASIRAFAAPGNMANNATVATLRNHGLDLVTTQGTMECNTEHGQAPGWNYGAGPCGNSNGGSPPYHWDCIPPDDVYFTSEGIQKANGVYSLPCGSANSNFETVEIGLTPEVTIGVGTCGCDIAKEECSMIASAEENARKSNGLHWTVLIMHPQTTFGDQNYTQWLDDFLPATQALEEYDVRFVTFEQMTHLRAPQAESTPAGQTLIV